MCKDPPPYPVDVKEYQTKTRKVTIYSWEEAQWRFAGDATLNRPIDADDDERPDPVVYPNRDSDPTLRSLLAQNETRLGSRSVSYVLSMKTSDGGVRTYSVTPEEGAKLDPGLTVKSTSSLLRSSRFEIVSPGVQ